MKKTDLCGDWRFVTDAADVGRREGWAGAPLQGSRAVTVPHIWQTLGDEMIRYTGAAWYERLFFAPPVQKDERALLCFGAVDYYAEIWVNGKAAGLHEGGFTPFELDVTALLESGENRLTVRVYDVSDNSEIPIGKQGSWYTRASGIWQPVFLELRPAICLQRVFITPDVPGGAAHVKLILNEAPAQPLRLSYALREHPSEAPVLAPAELVLTHQEHTFTIFIPDCKLWEPASPFLYELIFEQDGHRRGEVFGMREVRWQNGQILLNGRPLTIRGALDQAFYPDTGYFAPDEDTICREIALVKHMGFNLLRKHIKVELPLYLYWADRLGLLLWAEPPNYVKWTRAATRRFEAEYFSMLARDYNHPSIIIWSAYNEEWGLEWNLREDKAKQAHVRDLYERVKAFDPTRLVCDNSGWAHVKTDLNDHHRYYVCPDQLTRWQQDLDTFVLGDAQQNFVCGAKSRGEPVLVSEFGTWGLPDEQSIFNHYGAWPWWFANNSVATHQDDYKKPVTLRENFARYKLAGIFGTTAELARASQRRMACSNKALIEEMRKRPALSGYIITELSDIEWEANGMVDFFRNPKQGFESIPDYNGPLCVLLEQSPPNLSPGDPWSCGLVVVNDDACALSGEIRWELSGTDCHGSLRLENGSERFLRPAQGVALQIPADCAGVLTLRLSLTLADGTAAQNTYELVVVPPVPLARPVCGFALPQPVQKRLTALGAVLSEDADIVLTTELTAGVLAAADAGKHVLFFAEDGDSIDEKWLFTFRELDRGESWPRASSMNFMDSKRLCPLLWHPEMGFACKNMLPDYVVPFSDYKKVTNGKTINFFGNMGLEQSCTVLSGYFQGWLGQFGATTLLAPYGKGEIIMTTLKLLQSLESDPLAARVLDGLLGCFC